MQYRSEFGCAGAAVNLNTSGVSGGKLVSTFIILASSSYPEGRGKQTMPTFLLKPELTNPLLRRRS